MFAAEACWKELLFEAMIAGEYYTTLFLLDYDPGWTCLSNHTPNTHFASSRHDRLYVAMDGFKSDMHGRCCLIWLLFEPMMSEDNEARIANARKQGLARSVVQEQHGREQLCRLLLDAGANVHAQVRVQASMLPFFCVSPSINRWLLFEPECARTHRSTVHMVSNSLSCAQQQKGILAQVSPLLSVVVMCML